MGISIADLEGLARYLGITPDKITPLLILVLVIYRLIVSINKPMKKIIAELQCAIIEVQRLLKDRLEVNFDYKISPFIQSKSPIVLKPEYKHFIIKSGIGKQIKKQNNKLVERLEKQKPQTGLDAQKVINSLVISGDIEKYLDLNNYKKYVYEQGRTSADAMGILAVYLYEILIHQVIKD